jgi:hypothetical protein
MGNKDPTGSDPTTQRVFLERAIEPHDISLPLVSRTPMKGQFSPSSFVNSMPAHSQRKYDI